MGVNRPTKKAALITGGAQRIGQGITFKLSSLGYKIALHYNRSKNEAQRTAAEIKHRGGTCQLFQCDLEDGNATQQLIERVQKSFPNLNLLINNASIFEPSGLTKESIQHLNRHFAINFFAPYILTCSFAALCKKGHIINILDTNIVKNKTAHTTYLLSKKSLYELTKLAAVSLAPHIRVNAIAPGLIFPPEGKGGWYLQQRAKSIPLKRKGSLPAITQAVQFLIENDYLTGQTIFVAGGEHLL